MATDPTGGVVVVTGQMEASSPATRASHGRVLAQRRRPHVRRSHDRRRAARIVEPIGLAIEADGTIHIVSHGFGWWVGHRPGISPLDRGWSASSACPTFVETACHVIAAFEAEG